jgi:hypothetical protein
LIKYGVNIQRSISERFEKAKKLLIAVMAIMITVMDTFMIYFSRWTRA